MEAVWPDRAPSWLIRCRFYDNMNDGNANRIQQTQELYVSDPAAIHSVCVKDQDIYEETDMFI